MPVRAKFKLVRTENSVYTVSKREEDGSFSSEEKELRTLVLSPVYANGDPNHENTRFWNASPSGEIKLGTVNPEAWGQFELGKEYYIDFTPAE
jgi:hypothetical protein